MQTKPYSHTCIGTSESGMMTVYGKNEGETWVAICRTLSKSHAIDTAMDWGDMFDNALNLDK